MEEHLQLQATCTHLLARASRVWAAASGCNRRQKSKESRGWTRALRSVFLGTPGALPMAVWGHSWARREVVLNAHSVTEGNAKCSYGPVMNLTLVFSKSKKNLVLKSKFTLYILSSSRKRFFSFYLDLFIFFFIIV